MSTTLDEARETVAEAMLPRLGPRNAVAWAIARQRAEAIETISRAVFREEMERAETERRRRFEELKRTIGVPVYDEGGGGPEDGEEIARSRAPVGEDGALERMFASTPVRAQGDVADNGSDQRYAPFKTIDLGDGMGKAYVYEPTPPAKDTGEAMPGWVSNEIGRSLAALREEFAVPDVRDFDMGHLSWLRMRLVWGDDRIADLEAQLAEAAEKARDQGRKACDLFDEAARAQKAERAAIRERDEARSSLETAERRIGELESEERHRVAWMTEALRQTAAMAAGRMPMAGELGVTHIRGMPERIEGFSSAKLGRWLGWAQAAVVAGGCATLDDMKNLNKRCSEAALTSDAGTARSEDEEG